MRIKAKEIAAELGVSASTVSLALNGRPGVNPETRNRILSYVRQKEQALWSETTPAFKGTILILNYIKNGTIMEHMERLHERLPDLSETGQNSLVKKMAAFCTQNGYQLIYRKFHEHSESLERLITECRQLCIRGIYILAAEMRRPDIYPLQQLNIPIVTGDNLFYEEGIDSYLIDNREGIARGVSYLADKGHSHIVYLAETIDIFNFTERREAFLYEMARRELGDASNRIWRLGSCIDDIYTAMLRHLNAGIHGTTAFVLESSIISMGVYKALRERQLRIPRDISLLGFDSLSPQNLPGIRLTLIKGTHTRRHLAGVQHLIRHIEDETEEILKIYYRTRLYEGDSVFDKTKYIYH